MAPSSTATTVVLGGAHRQLARGRARRASSRSAANQRRLSSGSLRRAAASSSAPRPGTGERGDEGVELARARRPPCPGLAGDVHLDQDPQARAARARGGARARAAPTREATEWIRRTCGHDRRTRRLWSCADEVPLEQLAVRGDLALRGPGRGSRRRASTPACGEHRQLLDGRRTWSPRAPRPAAARVRGRRACAARRRSPAPMRSRFARTRSASQAARSAQPRDPRLATRARAFAAVGEEALVADRARRARRARRATPAASRRSRGDRAQVDRAAAPAAAPAERLVHLRADLVAAGTRAGADDRRRSARRRASSRSARTPSSSTPAARPRQPAWSIATAPGAAERDGRQSAVRTIAPTPAQRGRLAVGARRAASLRGRSARRRATRARPCAPCTW